MGPLADYVYWQAPLWQVLIWLVVALATIAWLVYRARRGAEAAEALAALEPALMELPVFLFDRRRGTQALTEAARRLLVDAEAGDYADWPAILEALDSSLAQGRSLHQAGWPQPDQRFVALPFAGAEGAVAGVLGILAPQDLPQAERPAADAGPAADWIELGASLRVHRSRPIALVAIPTEDRAPQWQERSLSANETLLLRAMLASPAQLQPADRLFAEIWPEDERSPHGLRPDQRDRLRRLVFQLRQSIEPVPAEPRYLRTIHGRGYALYADHVERED